MSEFIKIRVSTEGLDAAVVGIKKLAGGIAAVATAVGAMNAVQFAFDKVVDGFKDVITFGSKMKDLSLQTGLSVSKLTVLGRALQDAGQSADSAGMVINRMQRAIVEAGEGGKNQQEAFQKLGLSFEHLMGLEPGEQFEIISKAFQDMQDPAQRTATAMQLFGRSGATLIPVLAGGLEDARNHLGLMPAVLERNADIIDRIGDTFSRLGDITRSFFVGMIDVFGKDLRDAIEGLNNIDLTQAGQRVAAFLKLIVQNFKNADLTGLISLAIEGGFEIGMKKGYNIVIDWLPKFVDLFFKLWLQWPRIFAAAFLAGAGINAKLLSAFLGVGFAKVEETSKAWDEVKKRVDALIPSVENLGEAGTEVARSLVTRRQLWIEETERGVKGIIELEDRLDRLRGDWRKSEAQRFGETKANLNEQQALLVSVTNALRDLHFHQKDPEVAEKIREQIDKFNELNKKISLARATMGVDTRTIGEQLEAVRAQFENTIGNTGAVLARGFSSVVNSAIDGIASGIEGLISLTMTWKQALQQIGTSILQGVIRSIARMFAEWIVGRLFVKQVEITSSTAEAVAKAPSAMLTSISSWGIAAASGLAGFLAAMAITGGFKEGGYTGGGANDAIAGLVHKGEFVLTADQVRAIGLGRLQTAFGGGRIPVNPAASTGPASITNDVRIAAFDSRQDAERWASSSQARTWFVDMAKKTVHEWGRV